MTSVPAPALRRIMARALDARGVPRPHVDYVTDGLIEASLRGVDTHGVRLFRTYLAELDGGRASPDPDLRWIGSSPSVRTLDAGGALGLVAGGVATDELIHLARERSVAAVAVRNSNHFGAASCYTLRLARAEVLGLVLTNSDALVAPFRGRTKTVGTNPVSFAARGDGDDDLFCADFATSQTSYSQVRHRLERNRPLEPGWAIDEDGRDLCDAEASGQMAALHPLGADAGHKGECLGLMVEILTAVLTGEPLDYELAPFYEPPFDAPRRIAHLFVGFDIAAFTEPESFRQRLSQLLEHVRATEATGELSVQVPGDPERRSALHRTREGIPLDDEELRWWVHLDGGTEPELLALADSGSHERLRQAATTTTTNGPIPVVANQETEP